MKIFFLIIASLITLSCKNDETKEVEKKVFIVSKFNSDIEKNIQEAILRNPDLEALNDVKLYDYPKGEINFIFTNDDKIYYHYESLIDLMCGYEVDKIPISNRILLSDSLHQIKFENIYPFLNNSIKEHRLKNSWNRLKPISFSFQSDTIKNHDIYNLLENIDSLGYHQYNIRKMAPFEIKAIKEKLK